ncbi:HET-domain-containing protein [Dendrothele bispora CBS 962.96]|uniref:HET-domain-containing protein n=1 Tax=Dendrothele bispora (strain CBS 962.96) TaxID=1314807 RepID=A0A4S8KPC5_DENBC|nr:HET-domain-containing protein [Dendrothele bispora CBS 962.96]
MSHDLTVCPTGEYVLLTVQHWALPSASGNGSDTYVNGFNPAPSDGIVIADANHSITANSHIPPCTGNVNLETDQQCPRRFIDTHSVRLVHFEGTESVPHYAVLSHTWGEGDSEVTYADLDERPEEERTKRKLGYQKILDACAQARRNGLELLWVDSCCIDDTNEMEVENSRVCYAHLDDVSDGPDSLATQQFKESKWFSRGLTLLELIAPPGVLFFDRNWKCFELEHVIQKVAGISSRDLDGTLSLRKSLSSASPRAIQRRWSQVCCGVFSSGFGRYNVTVWKAFHRLENALYEDHPYLRLLQPDITKAPEVRCLRHTDPGRSLNILDSFDLQNPEVCPRRMINTCSLELEDFEDDIRIPHYAILSHTWGAEEIGYNEFDQLFSKKKGSRQAVFRELYERYSQGTKAKAVFHKIVEACIRARLDGLKYLWVDTCCIDQEDQMDVHRNVKNMYSYYRNSRICYAYLVDMGHQSRFGQSRWFARGWTLQELLAPPEVIFFDSNWINIGTRTELCTEISIVTGIPEDIVRGSTSFRDVDVQERMSWSVLRKTTRSVDRAYCLFGILDVSIEPDYTEDLVTAITRLQEAFFERYPEKRSEFAGDGVDLLKMLTRRSHRARYN